MNEIKKWKTNISVGPYVEKVDIKLLPVVPSLEENERLAK